MPKLKKLINHFLKLASSNALPAQIQQLAFLVVGIDTYMGLNANAQWVHSMIIKVKIALPATINAEPARILTSAIPASKRDNLYQPVTAWMAFMITQMKKSVVLVIMHVKRANFNHITVYFVPILTEILLRSAYVTKVLKSYIHGLRVLR